MKKFLLSLCTLACVLTGNAMDSSDTTRVTTLNDIIAQESKSKTDVKYDQHLRKVWGKNTFFNISYNKTKLSSDQFPIGGGRGAANEFKNNLGVGIQWGQTFNFHKKALGNVVFFGLDYTWMDVNFNQYKKADLPTPGYSTDYETYVMPWHNKKMSIDYGMSVGPSLTLYPFTPLHKNAADNIRLQGYFHVGYKAMGYIIKDSSDKNQFAWGHGLYTAFGANLTFNAIGFGFEMRNDNNINVKHVKKEYDNKTKMKFKEKVTRLYIQFRF